MESTEKKYLNTALCVIKAGTFCMEFHAGSGPGKFEWHQYELATDIEQKLDYTLTSWGHILKNSREIYMCVQDEETGAKTEIKYSNVIECYIKDALGNVFNYPINTQDPVISHRIFMCALRAQLDDLFKKIKAAKKRD